MNSLRIAATLLITAIATSPVYGRNLTPEVRAMVFGPPESVVLKQKVVRIALEGTDHRGFYKCPYMRVYVNGRGPFTFLFDTGASYTIVSSKVVAAAHVPVTFDRGGARDIVRLSKVQIGGLSINDLWAVQDDDWGVDGVFGFKAFGNVNLAIELKQRQLLVSLAQIPLPNSLEIPYEISRNTPNIVLTIGNRRLSTLIDTGDDAYAWEVRKGDLEPADFIHPPMEAESVLNGATVQKTYVTTLAQPLGFGPLHAESPVVGINDSIDIADLGCDFLQLFNLEFDVSRKFLIVQPLFAGPAMTVSGNLSTGFKLKFDGAGTVNGVIPGSVAAQIGMQTGDKVLSINGITVSRYDPRSWDSLLSARVPISVRWTHGPSERTDKFAVTELR